MQHICSNMQLTTHTVHNNKTHADHILSYRINSALQSGSVLCRSQKCFFPLNYLPLIHSNPLLFINLLYNFLPT